MAVGDDSAATQQWDEDMLGVRWQAAEDDLIGGFCVQPEGSSSPADGGLEIASFGTEKIAEHIADLHNASLDARPTACGYDWCEQALRHIHMPDDPKWIQIQTFTPASTS